MKEITSLVLGLALSFTVQAQISDSDATASLVDWHDSNGPIPVIDISNPPDGDHGPLTVFATRGEFDDRVSPAAQTCEDFNDTSIPPGSLTGFPAPADATTNNGLILPGEIVDGLTIQDNPLNDAGGGSPSGLVALGTGAVGAGSPVLVANTFVDAYEMLLSPAQTGLAFNVINFVAADNVTASFFDESDVLIGSVVVVGNPNPGGFLGVISPVPIARVTLLAANSGGTGAEGADDICFGDALGEGPARFQVSKVFDDGNTAEVDVVIQCNTGLPLMQPASISEGDPVTFVVGDFEDGTMTCEVTESVPAGYTASYDNGGGASATSCVFESVRLGSFNTCVISNSLNEVDVEVTKVWIDENPQFNPVNYAEAAWSCSNVAFACPDGGDNDCDSGVLEFLGNPATDGFSVFPRWDGATTCSVDEVIISDGNVEIDDSECNSITLFPGVGASCTIYNTRLYAGIPTLSQYGLAIMALLMLGLGLVGFRRFV